MEPDSDMLLALDSFVQTICGSFVQQIEPATDAVRMEEAVRLFGMAVCSGLRVSEAICGRL
jgi:hypothetical protein